MDKNTARSVYSQVVCDLTHTAVELREIGNGEYTVIVEGYFFLWSMQDWLDNSHIWLGKKDLRTLADIANSEPYKHGYTERKKSHKLRGVT